MPLIKVVRNPFKGIDKQWADAGEAINQAAKDVMDELADRLQRKGNGWDPEVLENLEVLTDGDQWAVGFDPAKPYAQKALETEYGTEDTPPNPLLRATSTHGKQDLDALLSERLNSYLFGDQ